MDGTYNRVPLDAPHKQGSWPNTEKNKIKLGMPFTKPKYELEIHRK